MLIYHTPRRSRFVLTALTLATLMSSYALDQSGRAAARGKRPVTSLAAKQQHARKPGTEESCSPESGVKLLIGILQRIGNEPQIAFQPKQNAQQRQAGNLANQIFAQNAVKPELAIRPSSVSKPVSAKKLAMAPPARSFEVSARPANRAARRQTMSTHQLAVTDAVQADTQEGAGNTRSEEHWNRLGKSVGKLARLSGAIAGVEQWRNERAAAPATPGNIKEYGTGVVNTSLPAVSMSRRSSAVDDVVAESSSADKDAAFLKPKNPAYFKHVREYKKHDEEALPADLLKRSGYSSQIAYIPPSLVSGVPGLHLGSTRAQASTFLSSRGKVSQKTVSGWTVMSLGNQEGKTTLQVYIKNGSVEAFRIFESAYVPTGLGVNLTSNLTEMKKKFGQPAFILNEPTMKGSRAVRGVKNYVYPVSQVCFQLSRPAPGEEPEIRSLLLFRFL